jgi:pimeloyl-ACP methyl ester carboxylesterase
MRTIMKYLLCLGWIVVSLITNAQHTVQSQDFFVSGEKNISIFVREITPGKTGSGSNCVLLIHGGFGGITAFDLYVPGGSFARDLAARGFTVYIMNVRGWEKSSFPDTTGKSMSLTSYVEAGKDIHAVVQEIQKRQAVKKVALFGWATGGHWAGYYTSKHPATVSHLISLNALYGVNAPWPLRKSFADPKDSTRFDETAMGKLRRSGKQSLLRTLNNSIPSPDKNLWRDSVVSYACATTATGFSKDGIFTTPGDFRRESFYMSLGRQYWKAEDLRVPVFVIRGAQDFWSRPADVDALYNGLIHAPRKKKLTLEEGTHFIFLDRPDKGRDRLLSEVVGFLNQ